MSSKIVDAAIARAGWDRWLGRRLAGDLSEEDVRAFDAALPTIDLLVLGALADRVRADEHGDDVRLHLQRPTAGDDAVLVTEAEATLRGGAFLRRVARARLLGSAGKYGISVRVDVDEVGVQIAQVALAFGANELVVPLRRSIITHDAVLKERELAALVVAAGRVPRIVEWLAGAPRERDVDATTDARRRFRAPGRDVQGST